MRFFIIMLFSICLNGGVLTQVIDIDTLEFEIDNKRVVCQLSNIDTPQMKKSALTKAQSKRCNISEDLIVEAGQIAYEMVSKELIVGGKYKVHVLSKNGSDVTFCIVEIPKGRFATLHPTINSFVLDYGYGVYRQAESNSIFSIEKFYEIGKKEARGLWKTHKSVMECLESSL